jgi:hypothetical protein
MKAFPNSKYHNSDTNGMDLRDYFAAKAMLALIAHPDSRCDVAASVYAKGAYEMADAMMEARK